MVLQDVMGILDDNMKVIVEDMDGKELFNGLAKEYGYLLNREYIDGFSYYTHCKDFDDSITIVVESFDNFIDHIDGKRASHAHAVSLTELFASGLIDNFEWFNIGFKTGSCLKSKSVLTKEIVTGAYDNYFVNHVEQLSNDSVYIGLFMNPSLV